MSTVVNYSTLSASAQKKARKNKRNAETAKLIAEQECFNDDLHEMNQQLSNRNASLQENIKQSEKNRLVFTITWGTDSQGVRCEFWNWGARRKHKNLFGNIFQVLMLWKGCFGDSLRFFTFLDHFLYNKNWIIFLKIGLFSSQQSSQLTP